MGRQTEEEWGREEKEGEKVGRQGGGGPNKSNIGPLYFTTHLNNRSVSLQGHVQVITQLHNFFC